MGYFYLRLWLASKTYICKRTQERLVPRKFRHMDSDRKLFSITKLLQIHLTWFQVVYGVGYEHPAATLFDHFSLVFIYIYIYIIYIVFARCPHSSRDSVITGPRRIPYDCKMLEDFNIILCSPMYIVVE